MESLPVVAALALWIGAPPARAQEDPASNVEVTIKEVDLPQAIEAFREFQTRLDEYRRQVTEGQEVAEEISAILADLKSSATAENNYNEEPVMAVLGDYVEQVMARRVDLIDFLESQRFRISYYANKMAASVRPEDVALLFGTRQQNTASIRSLSRNVAGVEREIADFLDSLDATAFDHQTFRPLPGISAEDRRRLAELQYRYQNSRGALEVAKSRLRLVEESSRAAAGVARNPELNVDLMLAQMFGTLDRIRLQMSADLLYLESYLTHYEQSSRAQDVFQAFQQLIAIQGGIEGPSQGLANVLDWLQESSYRQWSPNLTQAPFARTFSQSSDMLREAYERAGGKNN